MKRALCSSLMIVALCACSAGSENLSTQPTGSPSAEPPGAGASTAEATPGTAATSTGDASQGSPAGAGTAAGSNTAAATSSQGPVDPPPLEIDYPIKGIATIPDACSEPSVVLTTAPKSMGWSYDWTWTRQAFHANPQFQIVDWPNKPEKPMQVRLDMYEIPEGFALVGVCKDGATCNKLAAMYRGTVPTCDPRLHCGAMPISGTAKRSAIIPADGQWLPMESANVVGKCARIGVCLRVKQEPFRGNPGVACQAAPSKFKVDCAKKATCDEVVACLR